MDVLVVGAGDVGRWFGRLTNADVAFADLDRGTAEQAAAALTSAADDRYRAVDIDGTGTFEVVCIAVPMPASETAIAEQASRATAAIVDVTGAMRVPLAAMAEHASELERASFHPLFAPSAAPGTVAMAIGNGGSHVGAIREAFVDAGNDVVEIDPETHDDAMRTIQGRTHAAILAFALASRDADVPDALATPVYARLRRLAQRVTDGTPRVYADIQATFGGAGDVAAAAEALAAAEEEEFIELFESIASTEDVR